MDIRYAATKDVDPAMLDQLFKAIGWRRDISKWPKVLERSSLVCSAWDGDRLIGFGRLLEDGVMCMIYDVGVHPGYQRKGIGKRIMQMLIDHVTDKGYASIGLFAWEENPANLPFYESLGFEKSSGMELKKFMRPE